MLNIRMAREEDEDSIRGVHLAATGNTVNDSESYWDEPIRSGRVLIAEQDNLVIGFGTIDVHATEQIKHLYIASEYQGAGVGAKLLRELEEIGWRAGLKTLRLHAAPAAARFYARQGYREADESEVIDHDHEGVQMIKRLQSDSD
jgi:ribosomal protein S18 acetylase RimI-like enzyme